MVRSIDAQLHYFPILAGEPTNFELFLFDYSAIAYSATIETVNHLLCLEQKLDKLIEIQLILA
jgi:hypothetical protein